MSNWKEATSDTGVPLRCPKCGEFGSQIETVTRGKSWVSLYCATCAHDWREARTVREVR